MRVTNPKNAKTAVVRVNDRGPFHAGRIIDLSYTAALKLGYVSLGSTLVDVESVDPKNFKPYPAPMPPDENPPLVASAESAGYWLQLGAFGVQGNAELLLEKLKLELGTLAEVLRIQTVEGLYRLRAGPFQSIAEANDAAACDAVRRRARVDLWRLAGGTVAALTVPRGRRS